MEDFFEEGDKYGEFFEEGDKYGDSIKLKILPVESELYLPVC